MSKTLYLPYRPANGPKFLVKRDAETVARFLTEHGHAVEWIRRNYGGQGATSWNIRLTSGCEVHSRRQLEDMGLTLRYGAKDAATRKKSMAHRTTASAWASRADVGGSPSRGRSAAGWRRSTAATATRATTRRGAKTWWRRIAGEGE